MHSDSFANCRICGFELEFLPWGPDGTDPTWEICPCCGVEFGYEDTTVMSAAKYRAAWLAAGATWFKEPAKPAGWRLESQLENRPAEFREKPERTV